MTKILLVEDNEANREVLSRRLKKRGYEIVMAVDGQQAVDLGRSESPDLILMDLGLPILTGWEATSALKADSATAAIPIIALTAHAMSGDRDKAMDAGCDEYETKPIDLPRLVSKIEELVKTEAAAPVISAPEPADLAKSSPRLVTGRREIRGRVLVVDDNPDNRELLTRRLTRENYEYLTAENGEEALEILDGEPTIDLLLLDIMMPVMDGYEVLRRMKSDTLLRHVPVIVISASQETDNVVKCIEMGADDFLPKPFDNTILKARIGACIEKKRLRDQELVFRKEIETEKKRSDDLLYAIFPHLVVQELKTTNEYRPRRHENVAVLFTDIVGFTAYCDEHSAEKVVEHLQSLVTAFEAISEKHNITKIKTVGDAYMGAAGLLSLVDNPVLSCVKCGLEMLKAAASIPPNWAVRVGIHSGPVVAGVVGNRQYSLDIWGDTVNTASRVESHGEPNSVSVSGSAWQQIAHLCRGASKVVNAHGIGDLEIVQVKGFLPDT